VLGTVTAVDRPDDEDLWQRPTRYTVTVEERYKGEVAGPEVEVRSTGDGASCALTGIRTGERYVFFASRTADHDPGRPARLEANLCGGTAPASAELRAAVGAATTVVEHPRAPSPSAPPPTTPPGTGPAASGPAAADPSAPGGVVTGVAGPAVLAGLAGLTGLAGLAVVGGPRLRGRIRRSPSDSGPSATE
jgi:hypothetical protein